jgi:2,4-dichlorophenol 6-monooxygenase
MEATLASPEGLERVRAAIDGQAEHFDMPGLQLGFCYEQGAIVHDDGDAPELQVRAFVPSGRPGARLPHAWLQEDGGRRSLLDRLPLDRFVLLAGPDGDAWVDAVAELSDPYISSLHLTPALLEDLPGWLACAGIRADGALLVRPDQHVAWRSVGAGARPGAQLVTALREILGSSAA